MGNEAEFQVEVDGQNPTDRQEFVGAMSRILIGFDAREKASNETAPDQEEGTGERAEA